MSKLLQSCAMADLHQRRGLRTAARRPDNINDHLSDRIEDGWRRPSWSYGIAGVDLTITPANVIISNGTRQLGVAGETITAGMPVYLNGSNLLMKADANASAAAAAAVGISLHGATVNQPLAYLGSDNEVLAFGAILTVNTCYIVSATAGGIAPIADNATGWYLQVLGFAITTSTLKLKLFTSGVATA